MTLDKHVAAIIERISEMKNYEQVEAAISQWADVTIDSEFPHYNRIKALEEKLEDLSPLSVNSTQWSCLRYALVCLRTVAKEEPVL